ncbi:MAG: hypothetical protein HY394_05945 [Candidatus Diapherotrites archaeon]|nr:hypothetical protein [Candidatus Diapherotrites archaeon]
MECAVLSRRKLCLAVLLLAVFFSGLAFAQSYEIQKHEIEITLGENGETSVAERYYLDFPNSLQLERFKQKSEELGVDLQKWREFDPNIRVFIGGEEDVRSGVLSFDGAKKFLQLSYGLETPVVSKTSETGRITTFELKKSALKDFRTGDTTVIPAGTSIKINFPKNSEIIQPVQPAAKTSGDSIQWTGYTRSNAVTLSYRVFKEIAPQFELSGLLKGAFASNVFPLVVLFVIIVSAIAYSRRRAIADRIEEYVVEHSDLEEETFEQEEENQ